MLSSADHDLLITIAEQIRGLTQTCAAMTQALALKPDAQEVSNWRTDHEARIRVLEQFNWRLAGALAVLQVAIGAALHYWK